MPQSIALPDANDFVTEVELDERVYFIGLSWNSECAFWTLSIEDANRELIAAGIGIVPNAALLRPVRSLAVPPGELVVASETDADIVRDSFVRGVATLVYFTRAEVADLQAA